MLISRYVTLALVPIGLLLSALGLLPVSFTESFFGTLFGYGVLWFIATTFEKITGKQGMGQGDLDLLAFIGSFTGIIPYVDCAGGSGGNGTVINRQTFSTISSASMVTGVTTFSTSGMVSGGELMDWDEPPEPEPKKAGIQHEEWEMVMGILRKTREW